MESYYHILFDNLPEEHLEEKKLGDLVKIIRGRTPLVTIEEYWAKAGEGIPWIGIKDLTRSKSKFISEGERDITKEGFESCDIKLVPENTILFSRVGSVTGIMGICGRSLCLSDNFLGMPCEIQNIGYIWFLLQKHLHEFNRNSLGTTLKVICKKDLKEFPILCPPQKMIDKFNQFCAPFFKLQKSNEREIRELLKLQKYFVELTN